MSVCLYKVCAFACVLVCVCVSKGFMWGPETSDGLGEDRGSAGNGEDSGGGGESGRKRSQK